MFIYDILSKAKGVPLKHKGKGVNLYLNRRRRHNGRKAFIDLLLDLCEYVNTPKSIGIAIVIKHFHVVNTDDIKAVCSVDPLHYLDHYAYLKDAQACAFLKKSNMFKKRYNEKDLLTFYRRSEAQAAIQHEQLSSTIPETVYKQIFAIRGIIRSIIGNLPHAVNGRFGPGSTYLLRGENASLAGKMVHRLESTALAESAVTHTIKESMLHQHFSNFYHDTGSDPRFSGGMVRDAIIDRVKPIIVPGDRFCLVDKDLFKPRAMCPQPTGNMAVQLGLADILERRFYRFSGIKLCETDAIHKELVSSCYDLFGTIDLSDASDSISLKLIEMLFPTEWYRLIRSITCRQTRVGEKWYPNLKAFAQGCGITFILESIIFYAVTYVTVKRCAIQADIRPLISVYGDDIIVPIHYHQEVVKALELFSFKVNREKSFGLTSPFKESCGSDTFNGHDVRPIFFKEYDLRYPSLLILTNTVSKVIDRITYINDPRARRIWYRLVKLFEITGIRPHFVPMSCGDSEGVKVDKCLLNYKHQIQYTTVVIQRLSYVDIYDANFNFNLFFAGHTGRLFTRQSKVVWIGLRARPLLQELAIE